MVLTRRYPAPLRLNPRPCDVLAIVDVQSAARRWAETWERAWPAKQSAEIAALYHETGTYRSSPFREAEAGGALAYVERQFTAEEAVEWGKWRGDSIRAKREHPHAQDQVVTGRDFQSRSALGRFRLPNPRVWSVHVLRRITQVRTAS